MPIALGLGIGIADYDGQRGGGGGGAQPQTIFDHAAESGVGSFTDSALTLGVVFRATQAGTVDRVYFWKTAEDTATSRDVGVWDFDAVLKGSGTSSSEPVGTAQWLTVTLDTPAIILAEPVRYVAGIHHAMGRYPGSATSYFATDKIGAGGIIIGAATSNSSPGNGRYNYGASITFPSNSVGAGARNYYIDVGYFPT